MLYVPGHGHHGLKVKPLVFSNALFFFSFLTIHRHVFHRLSGTFTSLIVQRPCPLHSTPPRATSSSKFTATRFPKPLRQVSPSLHHSPVPHPPNLSNLQNFLALCASGYYTSTPIHRLIPSFMFQLGMPHASTISPSNPKSGRSIWGGTFADELHPDSLKHDARGVVSMANRGPGGTNASQFFVLLGPAPHLDGLNTVFGRVLMDDDGVRTLQRIEDVGVQEERAGKQGTKPKEAMCVESITIHANPLAS